MNKSDIIDAKAELVSDSFGGSASRISAAYAEAKKAAQSAITKVIECGLVMLQVKPLCPRGEFGPWLEKNCPEIEWRTANRWMNLAQDALAMPEVKQLALPEYLTPEILTAPKEQLNPEQAKVQTDFFALLDGKTQKEITWGFERVAPVKHEYHPRKATPEELARAQMDDASDIVNMAIQRLGDLSDKILALASHKVRSDLHQACIHTSKRLNAMSLNGPSAREMRKPDNNRF